MLVCKQETYEFFSVLVASPEPQESSSASYDPYFLDDPELKTGKNRTVISLACYMVKGDRMLAALLQDYMPLVVPVTNDLSSISDRVP